MNFAELIGLFGRTEDGSGKGISSQRRMLLLHNFRNSNCCSCWLNKGFTIIASELQNGPTISMLLKEARQDLIKRKLNKRDDPLLCLILTNKMTRLTLVNVLLTFKIQIQTGQSNSMVIFNYVTPVASK